MVKYQCSGFYFNISLFHQLTFAPIILFFLFYLNYHSKNGKAPLYMIVLVRFELSKIIGIYQNHKLFYKFIFIIPVNKNYKLFNPIFMLT
jgi:hypothetical protein